MSVRRPRTHVRVLAAMLVLAAATGGCGDARPSRTLTVTTTVTSTGQPALPGTGKPALTVGDKNYTEQFVLGDLYYLALKAQGYTVSLNRNIGPTEVTMRALQTGTLSMYPEYLNTWNTTIAGNRRHYSSELAEFRAARRWALAHGYDLLNPTPFSDSDALAVNFNYGLQHGLSSIADLRKVAGTLTLGAPLQFSQDPDGLPAIHAVYGVVPASFKPLEVGDGYQALDQGTVQAAEVNTTDGQLITGNYTLLRDPLNVFGWGNVMPVVPLRVIRAEGPQFAAILNRVTALLTIPAIRQLNAAVDVDGADPATVASRFLLEHGLVPAPGP
jgi:osmoprotectant transport system substrate-binding protein